MHVHMAGAQSPEEVNTFHGIGVKLACKPSCGYSELDLASLQEKQ